MTTDLTDRERRLVALALGSFLRRNRALPGLGGAVLAVGRKLGVAPAVILMASRDHVTRPPREGGAR